jgi:hypothetical protein
MLRMSLLGGFIAVSLLLAGCEIHLDDRERRDPRANPDYGYCDETGCYECDDYGCYPIDDPGGPCDSNYDCPAGCYCTDRGVCAEGGFCREHGDCPRGFVCDARASCVPKGSDDRGGGGEEPGICEDHGDCPLGSYCDGGVCTDSDTCRSRDCGEGWRCDERDTCVPEICEEHDECREGSYCDRESQSCIPTERCDEGECSAEGYVCDYLRDTCVPESEHPGSCDGDLTCDIAPPSCDEGETALIRDGCYTGACLAVERCDVPPRVVCEGADEGLCLEADHCRAVYAGYDCTTDSGAACQPGDTGCYCERFEFDRCEAR